MVKTDNNIHLTDIDCRQCVIKTTIRTWSYLFSISLHFEQTIVVSQF